MLKVDKVVVAYGVAPVIHEVSLTVPDGKIVTLLGANGAGKSTILKTISGLLKPISGEVTFEGAVISKEPPEAIVKRGIAHVPEGRLVFPGLTVLENLKMGSYVIRHKRKNLKENLDKVYELFPRLLERKNQTAGTLSGGEQQMLAIGRGLMSEPKLLMLDEPSLGLAPVIIDSIIDKIIEINKQGMTILLIEQNAHLALEVCDYGYLLSVGNIMMHGEKQKLVSEEGMINAYLGGGKQEAV
jgi:branched-chain amino acid transport system ATP-binding protein